MSHAPPLRGSRRTLTMLLLCFFISGAAGLIYQVAWSKSLGLVFGHTAYAIATVLTAFMAGLALGSAVLGRWSEKVSNPLALYGWVELAVAVTGGLSLLGIAGVRALYLATYPVVGGSAIVLLLVRFMASGLVLLPPTFLMGGTLPILVRGLTRTSEELGRRLGRLYWLNTLGAVLGTLAAGFVLLPLLGLRMTVGIAVALNVLAGGLALVVSRQSQASAPLPAASRPTPSLFKGGKQNFVPPSKGNKREQQSLRAQGRGHAELIAFAVVGLTAMVYEVAWSRLLATILTSSTYAFTLMLATFLLGIVLGSFLFEWWVRRGGRVTHETFAVTQLLTAVAAMLFLVFFQEFPEFATAVLRWSNFSFTGMLTTQFAGSVLAMLPVAVIFGFNFPVVTLLVARTGSNAGSNGASVGRAYAANTLGAIAGAAATGFLLVPWLGAFRTVALAAAANVTLGLLLELRIERKRRLPLWVGVGVLVLVAAIGGFRLFYNANLANFGASLYARGFPSALTAREMAETSKVIFERDGLNATISVVEGEGYVALRTNGKVDASTRDTSTQLMLAHVGAGFHPAPKRVLVIGFGSGMTVSALARYPDIEQIDCIEIEPAVLDAAPFLKALNRGVLDDPRLHIFVDDARNFLLTTREQYDLIVSEPSNPWIAGISTLFTREFYAQAAHHLQPGGMFVQWMQGYGIQTEDLRMIVATFLPHFAQSTLWRGEVSDYVLVGYSQAEPLSLARIASLWPNAALREDFQSLGMSRPEGVVAYSQLDDQELRRLAAGADQNTDDLTRLEYRAPRGLANPQLAEANRQTIWRYRTSALPRGFQLPDTTAALIAAAETLLKASNVGDIAPVSQPTKAGVLREAGYFLDALNSAPSSFSLELLRGEYNLGRKSFVQARQAYEAALRLERDSLEPTEGLALVALVQGDLAESDRQLQQAMSRAAGHPPALQIMARLQSARQQWREAADWELRYMATLAKPSANDYVGLGVMLANGGDLARAESVLQKGLDLEPFSLVAHRALAEIYRRGNRWAGAVEHLEFLVRYDPTGNAADYLRLAEAYRVLGQRDDADRLLRKSVRLFPQNKELQSAARL